MNCSPTLSWHVQRILHISQTPRHVASNMVLPVTSSRQLGEFRYVEVASWRNPMLDLHIARLRLPCSMHCDPECLAKASIGRLEACKDTCQGWFALLCITYQWVAPKWCLSTCLILLALRLYNVLTVAIAPVSDLEIGNSRFWPHSDRTGL